MRSSRSPLLVSIVMAAALSLTACGAGDEPTTEDNLSTAETPTPTETPTETPAEDPAETPAETPTTPPTETPAEEPEVETPVEPASNNAKTKDFSFKTPKGWKNTTKTMSQGTQPIEIAFLNESTRESVNVVKVPGAMTALDDPATKKSIVKSLKSVGFSNIQFPAMIQLGDKEALVTTSMLKVGAKRFYSHQVFVPVDNQNYVLTVGGFKEQRVASILKSIASSWYWK